MSHARSRRAGWISLAASAAVVSALTAAPAVADNPNGQQAPSAPVKAHKQMTSWQKKLPAGLDRNQGEAAYFVRFKGTGAADARQRSGASAGSSSKAATKRLSDAVLSTAKGVDGKASRLYTTTNAIPGAGIRANRAAVNAIAKRSDVVSVIKMVAKKPSNASTAQLTKALKNWGQTYGTGSGVKIGIIDTGIDYTHADFGGVGTAAAYNGEDSTDPTWHDRLPALGKAKIAGGYDFVGDAYDANSTDPAINTPVPDPNPLDCNEHGTHVSGTAAGYGVAKDGKTFAGVYKNLTGTDLYDMKIGPGMAPRALLYGLKVFGCEGSTNEVIPALDWALDPNGDGNYSDHLDLVNMSLGSDYGTVDDPENLFVNELSQHGVLSVIAMGNNGDLTDTGGAPGNAESSLAVASTVDEFQLRDGLKVNTPSALAGIHAGQFSIAYDWQGNGPTHAPVTGSVVAIPGANADGCTPFSDADKAKVAGKVVWLQWDDDDTTRRCGSVGRSTNAKNAGAIGSIFTSSLNVFGGGITGSTDIPVIQLPKVETDKLQPSVTAGTLNVTFDGKYLATVKDRNPAITDTISNFTSRGTHGSTGVVKPDVAAPGDTIASAGVGTGNDVLVISGTSMATPLAAGVSALVKRNNPSFDVGQIKAAIMNTAGDDLYSGENKSGNRYGPARVGAGRINAYRAAHTKVLAYVAGANFPVSASFGPVEVPISSGTVVKSKTVTIENNDSTTLPMKLSYDGVVKQPGVSYSVSPTSISVPAHSKRTVTVNMSITPSALRHTIDPTMAKTQLDTPRQFLPDASGHLLVQPGTRQALRVPVYGAAKPVSTTTAKAAPGEIQLTGDGVNQGSGDTAYQSFLSVLQLGTKSGALPVCTGGNTEGCTSGPTERSGDLKYVGAGSAGDWLWFGVATYGDWATIGNRVIPYVDYDVDGDGSPDYETYLQTVATASSNTDLLYAQTVDLNSGDLVDLEPVNFNDGNVDTNVFDSDVALLPVYKGAIALDGAGSHPITYSVGTFDSFTGSDIDDASASYNVGKPFLKVDGPLYVDDGGSDISYTASKSIRALVIHLHGATGARAEMLTLAATTGASAASDSESPTAPTPASESPAATPAG